MNVRVRANGHQAGEQEHGVQEQPPVDNVEMVEVLPEVVEVVEDNDNHDADQPDVPGHDVQEIEVVHVDVAGGEGINVGENHVDVENVDVVNDHVYQVVIFFSINIIYFTNACSFLSLKAVSLSRNTSTFNLKMYTLLVYMY